MVENPDHPRVADQFVWVIRGPDVLVVPATRADGRQPISRRHHWTGAAQDHPFSSGDAQPLQSFFGESTVDRMASPDNAHERRSPRGLTKNGGYRLLAVPLLRMGGSKVLPSTHSRHARGECKGVRLLLPAPRHGKTRGATHGRVLITRRGCPPRRARVLIPTSLSSDGTRALTATDRQIRTNPHHQDGVRDYVYERHIMCAVDVDFTRECEQSKQKRSCPPPLFC